MFKIEKANLAQNTEFQEQSLEDAGLLTKSIKLSSKKNGLNFMDADGSIFCYGRFSKAVKAALIDKTLTLEQLIAYGKVSKSDFEGQEYYSLTMPEALRGGTDLGNAAAIAKGAKPLVKAKASLAEISAMLEI